MDRERFATVQDLLEKKEHILHSSSSILVGNDDPPTRLGVVPKYYHRASSVIDDIVWFVCFATQSFQRAQFRIFSQSCACPFISTSIGYNEYSLMSDTSFWSKHGPFLQSSLRGYGYWLWKPFLLLKTLHAMNDNDILVYADTGCNINNLGMDRMKSYISLLRTNTTGILGFTLPNPWNVEAEYTKMDVLHELHAEHLIHTKQLSATIILLRKCEQSIAFVEKWLDYCSNHRLISDEPSIAPNHPTFREHRHDQSFFSLLGKLHHIAQIPDETEGAHSWVPIWASRQKDS